MTFEEKLAKSLEEIDALADSILSKSDEPEKVEEEDKVQKGVAPDEISSDSDDAGKKEGDDDEDDKEGDDDKKDDDKGDDAKKSITDEFTGSEAISKAMDVSDFLAEFTRVNGDVLDNLREDIHKSLETSTHTATILAKSFGAIMKSHEGLEGLVKSQSAQLADQAELIKSLQGRVEHVEKQPTVRKSVINTMEKSFDHSAGITSEAEPKQEKLSKGEIAEKLSNFALSGEHGVVIKDVIDFESNGFLRPEVKSLLEQ